MAENIHKAMLKSNHVESMDQSAQSVADLSREYERQTKEDEISNLETFNIKN